MGNGWGRQANGSAPSGGSPVEAFGWWGPVWRTPEPRSIVQLIRDGVLPSDVAAAIWALVARRASVVVVAGPSGAGKTTVATALLDLLPEATERMYLRGCYEPFAFLDDPAVVPDRTTLLANEISPHLPIYLWGPAVGRSLAAIGAGFQFLGTAHATSAEEFVGTLAGYPLRVPAADIARVHLVVVLAAWDDGGIFRREARAIASLAPVDRPGGGIAIDALARRTTRGGPMPLNPDAADAVAVRLRGQGDLGSEIAGRANTLMDMASRSLTEPAAVAAALAREHDRWADATGHPRGGP